MFRRSRTITITALLGLGLGAMLLIPGENATIATVDASDASPMTFDPSRPQDKLAVLMGEKIAPLPPLPETDAPRAADIRPVTAIAAPQQVAATPAAPDLSGLKLDHVGAAALNLRAAPSGSAAKVTVLLPGQPVHVGPATGNWVEVTLDDGRTGFVSARYLASAAPAVATTAAAAPPPVRAVVQGAPDNALAGRTARIAASLPVRAQPTGSADRVLTLDPGTRVRILDVRGRWLRIETAEGISGWIERAG